MSEPFALPSPFAWSEEQIAIDLPGGHAVFTTRAGGDLASEPAGSRALRRAVGPAPERWAQDHQVHGTRVRVGRARRAGAADGRRVRRVATARRDVACVVRAADCVPVALVAPGRRRDAPRRLARAGRGILDEGVARCRRSARARSRAAIGPGTRGVCCYEAGDEVHAAVRATAAAAPRGATPTSRPVARALLAKPRASRGPRRGAVHDLLTPERCGRIAGRGAPAGRQGALVWRS